MEHIPDYSDLGHVLGSAEAQSEMALGQDLRSREAHRAAALGRSAEAHRAMEIWHPDHPHDHPQRYRDRGSIIELRSGR